jgi:hypothetical protein
VVSEGAFSIRPSAHLKLTTHANLIFIDRNKDNALSVSVLDWLNRRSTAPVARADVESHLDELARRAAGGRSLPEVAQRAGLSTGQLQVVPFLLQHYSFARFPMDGFAVSVDLFNPRNELGVLDTHDQTIFEIFLTEARPGNSFPDLIRAAVDELPVDFVFSGHMTFTARFLNAFHYSPEPLEPGTTPRDFLWPLTFSTRTEADHATLKSHPVARAERRRRGVAIQVFETLSNGNEDDYEAAAHALGLRSVWELRLKEDDPPRPGARRRKRS